MEANNNVENLKSLKKDYDNGLVSALIGAGFSKNVSSLYLDWTSLLEDLIDDLFKLEINQCIGNYFHCNETPAKSSYFTFYIFNSPFDKNQAQYSTK